MKTFEQLTPEQQGKAEEKALNSLLEAIVEGATRFNASMNGDDLQARIDAAIAKAEEMRTPWFAGEYIMDTCADDLRGMARCDAENALYPEHGESVVSGIA